MTFSLLFSFYDYYSSDFKNCCSVVFRSARQFVDAFENARFTDENIKSITFFGLGSGSNNQGNIPFTNSLLAELKNYTDNNCDMSALFDGHAMKPVVFCMSVGNDDWSLIAGKRFQIDFWDNCIVINEGPYKIASFDFIFGDTKPNIYNQPVRPVTNNSVLYCYPNVDWDTRRAKMLQALAINPNAFFGLSCFRAPASPSDCSDLRTSEDGQNLHFIISDGVSNVSELDIPFLLSEGSTQEKAIKTYMNDSLYNSLINNWNLNNTVMARCYFNAGIVRSACTVRLVARVYGESLAIEPSVTPPYVNLDSDVVLGHDVDVLRANFEPCSDKPISIAEDLSAYLEGLRSGNDISLGFSVYQVIPYKVVIENCEALTDFCCDDETISDDDSIEIEKPTELVKIYGGNGGQGGDDVNIQCICDNLSNINNTLIAFKNANDAALSGISDTLSNMNIDIDNTCICDNLEYIKDGIIAVKESIDDKELSVINNNTVNPPVNNVAVNPPVNNVTVNPPVNNISLPTTELENIATNTRALNCVCASMQNLEVITQGAKESIDGVKLNLQCGKDDNIACILAGKELSVNVDVDSTEIREGLESVVDSLDSIKDKLDEGLINEDDEPNLANQVKELSGIYDSLNHKEINSDGEEVQTSLADIIEGKDFDSYTETIVEPCDYTYTRGASRNLEE